VEEWLQELPLADRAKITAVLAEIEEVGFQAIGCDFRQVKSKLWELWRTFKMAKTRHRTFAGFLRSQTQDEAFRVAFEAERIKLHIARWVKTARLQKGWSQAELARRVGTTQSVIGRLESATDEREPSLEFLGRLAVALGFELCVSFEKARKPVVAGKRAGPLG
jgi:ribosome-binding protein aMBF1 (putative translation factor)